MNKKDKIAIASFPRCGNTMVRLYLEKLTGLHTGSDMETPLNFGSILKKKFLKEGCKNQPMVKTHFPCFINTDMNFTANKIILIVREPCAVVDSCYNLLMTNSHNDTLPERDEENYKYFFEITHKAYCNYINYWINNHVPTLVLRYEDFRNNRLKELKRICEFLELKEVDNIEEIANEEIYNYSLRKKDHLDFSLIKNYDKSKVNQFGYYYKNNSKESLISDIFVKNFNKDKYGVPCKECGHVKEGVTLDINKNRMHELYIKVDSSIFVYIKDHISEVLEENKLNIPGVREFFTNNLGYILKSDCLENEKNIIKYAFFWNSWKVLFNYKYITNTTGICRGDTDD